MNRELALFFSVEHAGNRVPPEYAELFTGRESTLASHRGYDPGAGELAVRFSTRFHAPVERAGITRLLVDQNRSVHNRRSLFSEFTQKLPVNEKKKILDNYYWPYQSVVRNRIADLVTESGLVLHLAIHSFTPELDGAVRNCDIGLMYDPDRELELDFCRRWQLGINRLEPSLRVRRNYPYRGTSDGIVPALRKIFPGDRYIGLQIEINQKFPYGGNREWSIVQKQIVESFAKVVAKL